MSGVNTWHPKPQGTSANSFGIVRWWWPKRKLRA